MRSFCIGHIHQCRQGIANHLAYLCLAILIKPFTDTAQSSTFIVSEFDFNVTIFADLHFEVTGIDEQNELTKHNLDSQTPGDGLGFFKQRINVLEGRRLE